MTTVLIADDEPSLRLLVSATIESDEYDVVEAVDGDEAWDLLRQHRPTVALLDVQMPGRTGLDLTHAIRGDPELARTFVVLLTSKAQQADLVDHGRIERRVELGDELALDAILQAALRFASLGLGRAGPEGGVRRWRRRRRCRVGRLACNRWRRRQAARFKPL